MSRSFELSDVEWATVGTVGPPGQRTFYLQARQDDQLVTLKLEKQQVAAVAQFLGEILSDLPVPEPIPDDEALALAEPVLAEWAVGGLQLAYDSGADRIVILAEEIGDPADDADEPDSEEIGGEQIRAEQEPAERLRGPRSGAAEPDPDPGRGHRPARAGIWSTPGDPPAPSAVIPSIPKAIHARGPTATVHPSPEAPDRRPNRDPGAHALEQQRHLSGHGHRP